MSATTPGMRQIWMDTVVRCVDQRTANVCDKRRPITQRVSSTDSTDSKKSDVAGQTAVETSGHKTSSVASTEATAIKRSQSVPEKVEADLSSVARLPPSFSSDVAQRTDSQTTADVRCLFISVFLLAGALMA